MHGEARRLGLDARDRALAMRLAYGAVQRRATLDHLVETLAGRPVGRLEPLVLAALRLGLYQLAYADRVPAHAAVAESVELVKRASPGGAKLVNAVLRRVAERGAGLLAHQDRVRLDIPDWLWQRWSSAYGPDAARRIAEASLTEAALDISVKPGGATGAAWAERLGGRLLPTGSIRVASHGRIEDLPGYAEGAWWVQDAAAALVTRVAGDVTGRSVADLCAAPGGKTAGLAAAGALVTAVDVSGARLVRLRENLARLSLAAEVVEADAATWSPDRAFDVVLLDAPCTATGTIRRHPDILRLKRAEDVARMAQLQRLMLAHAASLVRPGGLLVYSTCSLEPEEGPMQIAALLATRPDFERVPITAVEIGAAPNWFTPDGELRTLPFHGPQEPPGLAGMDGFFVARLRRKS
ncbi:MAG TPA: RsmB/NOP family class I SAM-dependent RNA methyltransferase [Thermoanaerobaculia bacterium]|nr:RsmB/NOP family class I SAM-dependent RNA methyltransferase [Thermoanaerobaculia bacterium]